MDPHPRLPIGRRSLIHDVPPWVDPDASDYFITICCQRRGHNQLCLPAVGEALLKSVRFYHEQQRWLPYVFLLMPDHLHALFSFGRGFEMNGLIAAWKRHSATQYGIRWQRGFFEHRLRRDESAEEKMQYILYNPVRAGLCASAERWPYFLRVDVF